MENQKDSKPDKKDRGNKKSFSSQLELDPRPFVILSTGAPAVYVEKRRCAQTVPLLKSSITKKYFPAK